MKKRQVRVNSLFFKIVVTVIMGILLLAVILSTINLSISKDVFVENFAESQQKIFNQIDEEFYEFYGDIVSMTKTVDASSAVDNYLMKQYSSPTEEMKNVFYMQKQMRETELSKYSNLSVVLVSRKQSYVYNSNDKMAVKRKEILESEVVKKAQQKTDQLVCSYVPRGFTDVTKAEPVIIMARALLTEEGEVSGYLLITMKESDFRAMYGHFTSDTSEIVVLNNEDQIISSNRRAYMRGGNRAEEIREMAESMKEEKLLQKKIPVNGSVKTVLYHRLQSTNYKLVGIIDPKAAFAKRYNMNDLVILTLLVTGIVVFLIFLFIRQQTKPLGILVETMGRVREGKLEEYVEVTGTDEIRELSETYNQMIGSLNNYIERLMNAEEQKRDAEIRALQMQINPHYIYNTLAGIKWLIWQGDAGKSTKVIDAFISLLRNTISNTDEFVSVEDEIENLKNYIFINQVRYGDAINAEYFVMPQYLEYKVPKLILQPFVENAFFHAFPEGMKGTIQVFVKISGDRLVFEILDDGIGIDGKQLQDMREKKWKDKSEHFTGIGIHNVDDRIKLIYGLDYGVNIDSGKERGTKVTILFPLRKK